MSLKNYQSEIRAVGKGIGLALASVVAAGISVFVISLPLQAFGLFGTDIAFIIQFTSVQFGFLILAIIYLANKDEPWTYIKIYQPTIQDIGWIIAIPVLLVGVSYILEPALTNLGLPASELPVSETPNIIEQPSLLLIVFVWWYLIAAPSEELLFRGIIQGRLRETFTAGPAILFMSVCFMIPHTLLVVIDGSGAGAILMQSIQIFVSGLAFGIAYEKTGNLVVPSVGHAIMWTMVLFVV